MIKFSILLITITLIGINSPFYNNINFTKVEAKAIDIIVKPRKNNKSLVPDKVIQKPVSPSPVIQAIPNNVSVEKFQWYSFEEGMKKSKETNKYVFIDFYASWCGPCKNLEKYTYSNDKVAKYMSEKFISIKIDVESNKKISFNGSTYTEKELASNFIVQAYPSMFFMKNEEVVLRIQGFLNAADFYSYITYIGSDSFKNQNFEQYKQANKM